MNNVTDPQKFPGWLRAVTHFQTRDFLSTLRPQFGSQVTVSLRTPADAPVEEVVLRTIPDGEQLFTAMQPGAGQAGWRQWTAELTAGEPCVFYRFAIRTSQKVWWLNALGISEEIPPQWFDFRLLSDFLEVPWLAGSVFYQIYPDTFYDGDPSNNPNGEREPFRGFVRQTLPWGQAMPEKGRVWPFYGGDLQGIQQKLGYLTDLGINALYLNPIFTALTSHRYDVIDYQNVDPILGGNQALIDLAQSLHELGMHYLLDIVPNHCGLGHPWFQKALHDPHSPEHEYFFFDGENGAHASWMGFGSLPKLNYASQQLRELIYAADDSVFRRWLRPPWSADGWRVDVGNMLGRHGLQQLNIEIMRGIRQAVKSTRPDAYLCAENFFDAVSQLQGDGWDAVMNYAGFQGPLLHWLRPFATDAIGWKGNLSAGTRWETESLIASWMRNLAAIPWAIAQQQFNLLGSHDTPRLLTELGGDKILARLAAIIQFTFPGVPCVYYGDEVGLMDADGFGSRNCMPWEPAEWDLDLLDFYKTLTRLRRKSAVLQEGAFQILYYDDDCLLYRRVLAADQIFVSANRQDEVLAEKRLSLPELGLELHRTYVGLFSGARLQQQGSSLTIPPLPKGGEIWLPQDEPVGVDLRQGL